MKANNPLNINGVQYEDYAVSLSSSVVNRGGTVTQSACLVFTPQRVNQDGEVELYVDPPNTPIEERKVKAYSSGDIANTDDEDLKIAYGKINLVIQELAKKKGV